MPQDSNPWILANEFSEAELQRAIDFYNRSPDGQYDVLAMIALQVILWQRRQDRRGA